MKQKQAYIVSLLFIAGKSVVKANRFYHVKTVVTLKIKKSPKISIIDTNGSDVISAAIISENMGLS